MKEKSKRGLSSTGESADSEQDCYMTDHTLLKHPQCRLITYAISKAYKFKGFNLTFSHLILTWSTCLIAKGLN